MITVIELGEIAVEVERKDIKNVHLSVHPPTGRVRIAAPVKMSLETIRVFAISKIAWIKSQQINFDRQEREPPREFLERESHYLWGRRYLLDLLEVDAAPRVEVNHNKLVLRVRPGASEDTKRSVVANWYRHQLKEAVPPTIAKYERLMGVEVARFFVQRMKTKWGGCNPETHTIRLNAELAKKPPECAEYIVVHEMAHLIERRHNDRFVAIMDQYLPQWRHFRESLNALPLAHDSWTY